jgi:formylglycine-generating enzyme required for sulfatase activity
MKMLKRLTFLSLFLIILLFPYYTEATRGIEIRPISPSGEEVKGDQWLFVIGIGTYIHWPRLKTAISDAKAVKDVLLSRYHFDKEHLIELYDEQATRKNIIGKFRYLAGKMRDSDSLVIFYAGHGHIDSITKSGSWIPVESGESDASAWISNHDIKNYLKIDAIKAKHILLISDSCFSGDFFRGHRGELPKVTDKMIKKSYALTSRQAITSGGLEPVSDAGFCSNSVFSYFLVRTLKENQKPFLVPSDFFPRIKAGVAENAEQFPQFGSLKDTGGSQGGEIILFLKQDRCLEGLSQEAAERQKELKRLRALEKANRETKRKEAVEVARREDELTKLDEQITEMRRRLGTSAAQSDDSLDVMLAMVEKKEAQQRQIDEMKRQRGAEEAKRQAEIARLKQEQKEKRIAALKKDIEKYKKIASSPFGKDIKTAAWKSLIDRYPDAGEGLKIGDTEELKFRVAYPGLKKQITNSIGMKFLFIPDGTFMMGSPSSEPERDSDERQHKVTISRPFYLQTTEATQGQWKAIMGNNPSSFKGDNRPVEQVSWNDAQAFIKKLNQKEGTDKYRFPTEAEWEYACRAGTTTPFYTGRCISTVQANYNGNYPMPFCSKGRDREKTVDVASFSPNAWGLYDMHGNVWEWCQDWYGDYPYGHVTDPTWPSSGSCRVLRGGSCYCSAGGIRSALRNKYDSNYGYGGHCGGFRVVLAN